MSYKSESVNFPKCVTRLGLFSTKSFAIFTRETLSTRSLYWDKIDNELNRFCVIDDRRNVLILRANENERSGVAVVAPPIKTILIMVTTF